MAFQDGAASPQWAHEDSNFGPHPYQGSCPSRVTMLQKSNFRVCSRSVPARWVTCSARRLLVAGSAVAAVALTGAAPEPDPAGMTAGDVAAVAIAVVAMVTAVAGAVWTCDLRECPECGDCGLVVQWDEVPGRPGTHAVHLRTVPCPRGCPPPKRRKGVWS